MNTISELVHQGDAKGFGEDLLLTNQRLLVMGNINVCPELRTQQEK